MPEEMPFVRLTVLGSPGSGKTALINHFVNNRLPVYDCETRYPELYYRVVKLKRPNGGSGTLFACAEVEDTVFLESGGSYSEANSLFFDLRATPVVAPSRQASLVPFSVWRAPLTTIDAARPRYRPCTARRMGYVLLFDCNDQTSLDVALVTHQQLQDSIAAQQVAIKPVVFLVATKIDKAPDSREAKAVLDEAEKYSQANMLDLFKCSAKTGTNVRQMFTELIQIVSDNRIYWEVELPDDEDEDEEDEDGRTKKVAGDAAADTEDLSSEEEVDNGRCTQI